VITDGKGIPLAVTLTGGNRNDVTQLLPLIEAIPRVPRRPWPTPPAAGQGARRPRLRPRQYRALVQAKGIRPVITHRGVPHGSGLGEYRYVVEQAIALLHWFRRLRIRWEIRDDIHEAFLGLACAIICWRRLKIHTLC
jgi:hypothetical protein